MLSNTYKKRLEPATIDFLVRFVSCAIVSTLFVFLINNHLTFWMEWPGAGSVLQENGITLRGSIQWLLYPLLLLLVYLYVSRTPGRTLRQESDRLSALAAYVVRAAFWAVLLVGVVDMLISLLRVEEFLPAVVGEQLNQDLARSQYRGAYVHTPLLLVSLVIAAFNRSLGFIWLALMVVLAEFGIVVSRFVFSYEQAFMGDLVRFWYAALFLFASAYTLVHEGHVRVDVLYARFSIRTRAISNLAGLSLLGLPLCWLIILLGMWDKGSSINSPLISFEISQSGYGMYVKYLMVGYLVVFAVSMIIQFAAYLLSNVADLKGEPGGKSEYTPH